MAPRPESGTGVPRGRPQLPDRRLRLRGDLEHGWMEGSTGGDGTLPLSGEPSRIDCAVANPQAIGLAQRVGLRMGPCVAARAALL
eukprot:5488573-Pyramimonas_sp.AAC.1